MDVNSTILQLPSPTAASPSEGTAPRPHEGKSSSAGGTKKSFASTLRTAQQREDKNRLQHSDDTEPRRAAKAETETDQVKGGREDATRSGESKGGSLETKADRSSRNDIVESRGGERNAGGEAQASVFAVPGAVLESLGQTVPVQNAPEQLTDVPQAPMEQELQASPGTNGMTEAPAIPVLIMAEKEEPATVLAPTSQTPALPRGTTVSEDQQSRIAPDVQPLRRTGELSSGQPLDPMGGIMGKAVDQEAGELKGAPAQGNQNEKQVAPVQPTTEAGKQTASVSQELSRLDTGGPQPARLVEPPVQQKQAEPAVQPHHALHSPLYSLSAGDGERAGQSTTIALHGVQIGADSGQPSDLFWSNQAERQSASGENHWAPPAPMASSQPDDGADNHPSQPLTVSNAASVQPRSADSRPAPPAGLVSTVSPAHDIEPFIPTMSRSVVFEIAEPDLGRINVRVAMANELVHAYLSSDRSEIGQFLINGQDRLQSALQANGLEMGQFRVDIDRQGAGRSFQHGPSQDQSRTGQQPSSGSEHESGVFERHEASGLSYAGRLNVVA